MSTSPLQVDLGVDLIVDLPPTGHRPGVRPRGRPTPQEDLKDDDFVTQCRVIRAEVSLYLDWMVLIDSRLIGQLLIN